MVCARRKGTAHTYPHGLRDSEFNLEYQDAVSGIDRKAIFDGRERRARTPFQARHFVHTMRGLFEWAIEAGHAKSDPTQGVKVHKPKTAGFAPWGDDEVERYEKRWPIGTRERVMFDIFLYTGLRRGDAARLGKQHVRTNVIRIDTEKTGTRVTIPILPVLTRTSKAGPVGDLAFIATKDGRPMSKEVSAICFVKRAAKQELENQPTV